MIHDLKMDVTMLGQLYDKFQTFCVQRSSLEVCEESHFKSMIGILGDYYIGSRIFEVVLQLSLDTEAKQLTEYHRTQDPSILLIWREAKYKDLDHPDFRRTYIVVEDYIIYMDMIYNGEQRDKDRISFMLMDEVGQGKVTYPFYENFQINFMQMYGEMFGMSAIDEEQNATLANYIFKVLTETRRTPELANSVPHELDNRKDSFFKEEKLVHRTKTELQGEQPGMSSIARTNNNKVMSPDKIKSAMRMRSDLRDQSPIIAKKLTPEEQEDFVRIVKEREFKHRDKQVIEHRPLLQKCLEDNGEETRSLWRVYFDFEDFMQAKLSEPELFDWIDEPEAFLQGTVDEEQKVDLVRLQEYHERSVDILSETSERLKEILEQLTQPDAKARDTMVHNIPTNQSVKPLPSN